MVIKITLGPAADSAEAVVAAQDGEEQGGLTVFGRPSATSAFACEKAGKFFSEWAQNQTKVLSPEVAADDDDEEAEEDPLADVKLVSIKQAYIDQNDVANWREQDHYKLMGLQNYRLKATDAMIRAAFKIQTIEQHPDKKSTNDWSETDRAQADGYYTCVKKAFEVLGDVTQRRLYDSVDATDDDDVVPAKTKKEGTFFKKFGASFERNKKWFAPHPSDPKPDPGYVELPSLGGEDAPKEFVDNFYEVWYAAESWREFGYFDEETANDNDSREQKRWIEKKNKAARKRKNKEEKARQLLLIDNALASDPRIKKHKAAAKQAKLDAVQAKEDAAKAEKEARVKAEEDAKAAEEIKAKSAQADGKAIKEAAKRAKKAFVKACKRSGIFKDGYGEETELSEDVVTTLKNETATATLQAWGAEKDLEAFAELVRDEIARRDGKTRVKQAKTDELSREWTQTEQKALELALKEIPKDDARRWERIAGKAGRSVKATKLRVKELMSKAKAAPTDWTEEELTVVVKAASKVFPPGTCEIGGVDRWGQIAAYLKTHAHTSWTREKKDIIAAVNQAKNVMDGRAKKVADGADGFSEYENTRANVKDKSVPSESVPSQKSK